MISKYIKYLKRSPKHIQDYNLLIVSGILTSIIAVLWLHFYYGFFKFDFYNDITISESELRQSNSSNLNINSQNSLNNSQNQSNNYSQTNTDISNTLNNDSNSNNNSVSEIESPIDQVMSIFNETKSRLQDIKIPEFGR